MDDLWCQSHKNRSKYGNNYFTLYKQSTKEKKKSLKQSMAHTRQDIIYSDTFSNHCNLKK